MEVDPVEDCDEYDDEAFYDSDEIYSPGDMLTHRGCMNVRCYQTGANGMFLFNLCDKVAMFLKYPDDVTDTTFITVIVDGIIADVNQSMMRRVVPQDANRHTLRKAG